MYIKSTYNKGLNKDLSKGKLSNDIMFDNLNFNVVTEQGLSTFALETPKGNKYSFEIPSTFEIYKITIKKLPSQSLGYALDINGQQANIVLSTSTTIQELFQQLQILNQVGFKIQLGLDFIYVIGTTSNPVISSPAFNNPGASLKLELHIPAQSDLTIIGWKQIRDSIGILTTNKDNINPFTDSLGNVSQIWKLDYDETSDTVISPNGTPLNCVDHLYYNDRLNLSLKHEIYREIEGRYENTKTQRFYWTDNFNYPRAFNFSLENSFTVPVGLLDWKADVNLSVPILDSIIPNSGNIPVGKIGYFYQLQSADGALSPYSEISNLIILTDSNYSESSQQYKGAAPGTNSTKSVKFYINNIDPRYSIIKVCYVLYQVNGVPEFFQFNEFTITSDRMFFVHTGNEADIPLSLEQVINPNIGFDTCKTITYKYNRLYAANTTTKNFKLDFDARAYRFSGEGIYNYTPDADKVARVWSQDGRYKLINTNYKIYNVNGNPITPQDVADSEDLVNAYNDESGTVFGLFPNNDVSNWEWEQAYKYQIDGKTLGGSGLNLSYKFIEQDLPSDFIVQPADLSYTGNSSGPVYLPRGTDFVNVPAGNNTSSINLGINSQDYPQQGFANLKSSSRESIFLTLQRGETYRVGIRALNVKGETSFVNWIGDIRVPEAVDRRLPNGGVNNNNPDFTLAYSSNVNNTWYMIPKAVGIEFTIKTSALPDDITAFQIVYVERTLENRTRFGTGLHLPVLTFDGRNSQPRNRLKVNGEQTDAYILGAFKFSGNLSPDYWNDYSDEEFTSPYGISFIRSNYFALQSTTGNNNRIGLIKSPMADASIPLTSASYMKLHEASYMYESQYFAQNGVGNTGRTFGYWLKYKSSIIPIQNIRNTIEARQDVGIDSIVLRTVAPSIMQYDFHNVVARNQEGNGGKISALGQTSEFVISGALKNVPLNIPASFNQSFVTDQNATAYESFNNVPAADDNKGTPRDTFRLVQYCTFNIGQYGGPWRANRYNNEYIAFGNFVPIDLANPVSQTYRQFGDTWIGLYSSVYFAMHWISDYNIPTRGGVGSGLGNIYDPSDDMKQASVVYPCEAPINGDMRYGLYWASDQVQQQNNLDEFAQFQFDENLFNLSYDQKNSAKKFIPEPFNTNFDEEQPHRVWVSQNKLDSEVIDSWRIFRVNDYKDLEGTYGQINKIVNFKDQLIALQDRATCWVQSEENSALKTDSDLAAQIGTGDILTRYQYVSIETGTIHQHSVIVAPDSVHFFDARIKKYMMYSQGVKPVSDIEGLSAFFRENVFGDMFKDQVLLGYGIHGVYDTKYNRAFMTFLNRINDPNGKIDKKFTIAYNSYLQAFEQFNSFTPNLYLNTGKRLLSANPVLSNKGYIHYEGNINEYYGSYYPASVTLLVRFDESDLTTARVDTVEFWSELFNQNGVDIPLQSITGITISNDYQSTQNSLNPLTNITLKRRERTWRIDTIKDFTPPYNNVKIKPYLRDKYVRLKIDFNKPLHRLVLHDINTQITKSYH